MDSVETNERAKMYHYKVDQLLSRTPYQKKARPCVLQVYETGKNSGNSSAHVLEVSPAKFLNLNFVFQDSDLSKVLYWPAMSEKDFAQVEGIAASLNQALGDIQIDCPEPLVVDFGSSL